MKKLFSVFVSAMIIVFLVTSYGVAYDKVKPETVALRTDFNNSFTYVRVVASGTAIGLVWDDKTGTYEYSEGYWMQGGSGMVAAAGYVVTAAHVVSPDTIMLPEDKCISRYTDVIARTSRLIMLFDYKDDPVIGKVLYENTETDLAVITYNHERAFWFTPTPFNPVYNPTFIEKGDVVCAVVHERNEDGEMTSNLKLAWGTVVEPGPYAPQRPVTAFLNPWDITLDVVIQPGDSGSPLFAFRDGVPIFIGVTRAMYFDGYSYYSFAVQLPVVAKLLYRARG